MVFFAAAEGDLFELIRLHASGLSITSIDYDGRTPLHLAASNGHAKIVKYLIVQACKSPELTPIWVMTDRYGNTPLDDSIREGHTNCQEVLETVDYVKMEGSHSIGSRNRRISGFSLDHSSPRGGPKASDLGTVDEDQAENQSVGDDAKSETRRTRINFSGSRSMKLK